MDNHHSNPNDLSLQGTAIQPPGTSSSRPSSARSNSQSKRPITPSKQISEYSPITLLILGSAKDHRTTMNTSVNFSSARQR